MLDENYFPLVGSIRRNPRYTNKRTMDPQLKCFLDEQEIELPPEWSLPTPNALAAYISLAKYAKDILPMDESMVRDMNRAGEYMAQHFGIYMSNSRILSYEEAKALS